MPPPGMPRPDAATYHAVAGWLETEIDRAWAATPNPGRINAVHRLNRTEYNNAIRDLFALDVDVQIAAAGRRDRRRQLRQLRRRPHDLDGAPRALSVGRAPGHAAGDGPASGQSGARDLRDSAARRAGRSAERRPAVRIARRHRRSPRLSRRRRVPDQGPPPAAVSGLHHGHGLAAAARRPARWQAAEAVHRRRRSARAGRPRPATPATASPGFAGDPEWENYMQIGGDAGLEVRVPVDGGPHIVGVSFVRELLGARRPAAAAAARPSAHQRPGLHGLRQRRLGADRRSVPGSGTGEGHAEPARDLRLRSPEARRRARLRDEDPVEDRAARLPPAGDERGRADAARVLRARPPATAAASTPASSSRSSACLSIPTSCCASIATPRSQSHPARRADAYRLSDLELASRLSFFLWSSIPDERLLDLAERGQLTRPAILEQQVRRMLADPRATDALVDDFAAQWLNLRRVERSRGRSGPLSELRRQPAAGVQAGNRAVRRQHASRGSQRARPAERRLHVRQRAAGAALRHSGHLRQPLPARHAAEPRSARRPARATARCWPRRRIRIARRRCCAASGCSTTSSACPCRRRRPAWTRRLPEPKPGAVPPTIRERLAQHRRESRRARAATRSSIRSGSRSRTSTPSAAGEPSTNRASRSTRAARTVSGAKVEGLSGLRALLLEQPDQFPAHGDREAAGLRARPPARVLRSAGGAQDRARRGGAATTAGRRSFSAS